MKSSFNPNEQHQKLESKIVVALERVSEAFRVLLWNESKEHSLSPIQIQILIFLYFHDEEKCKVGYLAEEFNMTKATISDSVKILLSKNLIIKETDSSDTRSFVLHLSEEGRKIAKKSSLFASSIEMPLQHLSEEEKRELLESMMTLITHLNKIGVISIQRMCFNCDFYKNKRNGHYCNFLNSPLQEHEIRLDCPEHKEIA